MKAEERIWWEELADQYEKWAEEPPIATLQFGYHYERHTCSALYWSDFGWRAGRGQEAYYCMKLLWFWKYGNTGYPAGATHAENRDEKRFEFCHYMAETIREYLDAGRGPWE